MADCNKIQANNLACNKISLTEQWKKGELPEDFYYAKCPWCDEVDIRYIHNEVDDYEDIIMPVPSFEEWQASEKWIKSLEEKIKIYERKDKQATEISIAYNELLEENAQLKELLKECRRYIDYWGYEDTHGRAILPQIDEALK